MGSRGPCALLKLSGLPGRPEGGEGPGEVDMLRETSSATAAGTARAWILASAVILTLACDGDAVAWRGGNEMPEQEEAALPIATVQGVRIDEPTVTVPLPLARTGEPAGRLRQALAAPAGSARTELVLDDITVSKPPGVQFDVFLSTSGPQPRRQYLGTLSFFGVSHRTGKAELPRRTFEVGEKLRALKGNRAEVPEVQVVFEATEGAAGSKPGDARALFNREAGLEVGSIQLRVQSDP